MPNDKPTSSPDESPEAELPAAPGISEPDDELTPEAKRALAQVQVNMIGQTSGAKNYSARRARIFIAICFVLMTLFLFVLWGVTYEQPVRIYTPTPKTPAASLTPLPGNFAVALPPGWTAESPTTFSHPSGLRFTVAYGHVKEFAVSPRLPRAFGGNGKPIFNAYTNTAYRVHLPEREKDLASEVEARYIALGDNSHPARYGLEGIARKKDGTWLRAFALFRKSTESGTVQSPFRLIEIRFSLPTGENTPAWKSAEVIFRSLVDYTPPAAPEQKDEPIR